MSELGVVDRPKRLVTQYDLFCSACSHKSCCTVMPGAFVGSSDAERIKLAGYDLKVVIEERTNGENRFRVLKKKSGACIFWNPDTQACTVYRHRPFDCFLFPFDIILVEGVYRWMVYECNGDQPWCNLDEMLEMIENMPEFVELCKEIHEYATYQDELVLKRYNRRLLRPVRLPQVALAVNAQKVSS